MARIITKKHMKTRQGFVSNSSSSSFVVSAKPETPLNVKIEVDITEYVDYILKTPEDIKKYLEGYYGEIDIKEYDKLKTEIDKGNWVYVGSFSDENDDGVETYLCHNGIKQPTDNSFTVIESNGGY